MVAGNAAVENLIQQRDVVLQANALADLVQMLLANARLEFWIMQQQVCELCALLNEIKSRHPGGLSLELGSRNSHELGEHVAGVVEGQCLVEITGKNVFLTGSLVHVFN